MIASSFHEVPVQGMGPDGKSGGSKPLTDGGRISLAGVVLAALPTQASRRSAPTTAQAQKTHRFDGGGYRCKRSFDAPCKRVCYGYGGVSTQGMSNLRKPSTQDSTTSAPLKLTPRSTLAMLAEASQ